MAKQARQRAPTPGPSTSLLDLWRGDLSEVIAAFLPLKAIATMPVSRRFRERHPVILFSVARRHGALRAGTGALLDAVAATGREWSRFSPDLDDGAWDFLADTCSTQRPYDGVRHIRISTTEHDAYHQEHGGGLEKRFDIDENLCLRRVRYRFSFSDPTPDASHARPMEHGLAYFFFDEDLGGLFVCPTATGYVLKWFNTEVDEEAAHFVRVEPDTWYDVTITYDWARLRDYPDLFGVKVVVKGDNGSRDRARYTCRWVPLTLIELYNFSHGIARYTAIDVRYSAKTPRDLRSGDSDLDDE